MAEVEVERVGQEGLEALAPAVAALRIQVFRAFPYLYEGDLAYEAEYLEIYVRSSDAVGVIARHEGRVVGVATGLPLEDETDALRAPFEEEGIDPAKVFYFGESVLLPEYRGQGLGHRFFDEREAYARSLGRFELTAFAAVERDPDDPRRPEDHRPLDSFWRGRGYERQDGMRFSLPWRDVGEAEETEKTLVFWTRPLER